MQSVLGDAELSLGKLATRLAEIDAAVVEYNGQVAALKDAVQAEHHDRLAVVNVHFWLAGRRTDQRFPAHAVLVPASVTNTPALHRSNPTWRILRCRALSSDSPYIFGLHEPGGEYIMAEAGRRGWIVFTEAVGSDPNDTSGKNFRPWSDQGYGILCRINNGYGSGGTIPVSSRYPDFARRVANFVAASRGCKIWVIGNEPNHAQERPQLPSGAMQVITPTLYAQCYRLCRDAIHAVPGHADDLVLVAAVAPWNVQTKYPTNETGNWITYFGDILRLVGPTGCDGIALHTYTHGSDPALVTSRATMNPPFQNLYFNFLAYQNFMAAIPASMRSLPVYITETDQDVPWLDENNGWVKAAYAEINRWNQAPATQKIRSLVLYRWPRLDPLVYRGQTGRHRRFPRRAPEQLSLGAGGLAAGLLEAGRSRAHAGGGELPRCARRGPDRPGAARLLSAHPWRLPNGGQHPLLAGHRHGGRRAARRLGGAIYAVGDRSPRVGASGAAPAGHSCTLKIQGR